MPLAAAAALCKTQNAVLLVSGGWRQRDAPDPPVHETHTPLGSTRTRNSGTCTRLLATRCQNPAHSACSSMQRIRHSAFVLLRRSAFGVCVCHSSPLACCLLLAYCLLLIVGCWLGTRRTQMGTGTGCALHRATGRRAARGRQATSRFFINTAGCCKRQRANWSTGPPPRGLVVVTAHQSSVYL
jgi:hypothetical protein